MHEFCSQRENRHSLGTVSRVVPNALAWLPLAAALLILFVSCGTGSGAGDPSARFFAVHNALQASGMTQIGGVSRGQLAPGASLKLPIDLGAQCVTVVALGAGETVDLELSLINSDGKVVAHDDTRGPDASIRYCPDHPGKHELALRMADGWGTYLISLWGGGVLSSPGSDAGALAAVGPTGAGTCESPIILIPGQSYVGDTGDGRSMEEGTCGNTTAKEIVYRMELSARQRVVLEVNAQFDSVLYVRKADCEDRDAEVACNDDFGGAKRSRVDEVLEPGVYFVFVDGYHREEGAFRLTTSAQLVPTAVDMCSTALPLAAAATVSGQLSTALDKAHASCGRDAKGPDVTYRLDVPARSRVRLTEQARGFRPVLHLRAACEEASSEIECDEGTSTLPRASIARVLDRGTYWVFADSTGDAAGGDYVLQAEIAPEAGAPANADTCGEAVSVSSASGQLETDTFPAHDDIVTSCGAADAPDTVYRLDLGRKSYVAARVANDEAKHVIALQRACGIRSSEMACGSSVASVLSPGTYFLIVEGARSGSFGRATIAYRIDDLSSVEGVCAGALPIEPGHPMTSTTVGQGNHFSPGCAGPSDSQDSPDRVYRLRLARTSNVRVVLETKTFPGVVSLRRVCSDPTTEIACTSSYSAGSRATITKALHPGTYAVVVDGRGTKSEGDFTVTVTASPQESTRDREPARPRRHK